MIYYSLIHFNVLLTFFIFNLYCNWNKTEWNKPIIWFYILKVFEWYSAIFLLEKEQDTYSMWVVGLGAIVKQSLLPYIVEENSFDMQNKLHWIKSIKLSANHVFPIETSTHVQKNFTYSYIYCIYGNIINKVLLTRTNYEFSLQYKPKLCSYSYFILWKTIKSFQTRKKYFNNSVCNI